MRISLIYAKLLRKDVVQTKSDSNNFESKSINLKG